MAKISDSNSHLVNIAKNIAALEKAKTLRGNFIGPASRDCLLYVLPAPIGEGSADVGCINRLIVACDKKERREVARFFKRFVPHQFKDGLNGEGYFCVFGKKIDGEKKKKKMLEDAAEFLSDTQADFYSWQTERKRMVRASHSPSPEEAKLRLAGMVGRAVKKVIKGMELAGDPVPVIIAGLREGGVKDEDIARVLAVMAEQPKGNG